MKALLTILLALAILVLMACNNNESQLQAEQRELEGEQSELLQEQDELEAEQKELQEEYQREKAASEAEMTDCSFIIQ